MLFRRRDDRQIGAMKERIRALVSRQPGGTLCTAADSLGLSALGLARFLDAKELADPPLIIDVVTALVYESGIDPRWLLTGEYDSGVHRHALMLGEDRSAEGRRAVRDFIDEQYRRVRRDAMLAWLPGRSRRHRKTRPRMAS